ncbi:GAF domain-containing sensor histidine kinase [Pseudalkalibacillus decolorationis]|uniref:GAF domain-containing sensor histidine kinase n=1 Tax=Pseudalkalibacillus decolorationis TaxID=163879 RepID=UPI0021475141|nr:GAF domain-containing sensor histidine kinase [Pseudalkalibacillus decolorationis]
MNTLKIIAETLNQSNDLREVLQSVLEKLLEITGLSTGWIFLIDEEPIYSFVADVNLPPALSWGDKQPMCKGSCWCLEKIWDGRLQKAVNIINCKRIEDAIEHDWGDTQAITHHATVPLIAGGEKFGVLNIAAPHKNEFTEDELDLLQSVAFQIGTAIKRTRLYEAQQQRAEQYTKLDEISRMIWKMNDLHLLPEYAVEKISHVFELNSLAFLIKEENVLALRSISHNGTAQNVHKRYRVDEYSAPEEILQCSSFREDVGQYGLSLDDSFIIPLSIGEEWIGCLIGNHSSSPWNSIHPDVIKALGDHLSLVVENARLYERGRELALIEERNRLARDLHDSVNQKLFSISLTARGLKEHVKRLPDNDVLIESLDEMQSLSQEVVGEMRAMIWQLRPVGLEEGVVVSLKKYGESLGLKISEQIEGVGNLPRLVEETMWRVGQEALNNVHKHARTDSASISLRRMSDRVQLSIKDEGRGFVTYSNGTPEWSFGLSSMKERTEIMGGSLVIDSQADVGTTIMVIFPNRLFKK